MGRASGQEANRIREWTRAGNAARNRLGYMREPLLAADEEPLPAGVYYLEPTATLPRGQRPPRQLLVRSDMNVTLKASTDEALAWVTDLKTGQPVAGAKVRFADNGGNDVKAVTDADGVAEAKLTDPAAHLGAAARHRHHRGGRVRRRVHQLAGRHHAVGLRRPGASEPDPYVGYVYTDRPIYRPGQTVYWKAIFRRDNDAQYALPAAGQPVTVTIRDDQGNQLLEQQLTLNPVGAVDGKLELGPDAALGYYYVSLQMDKERSYGVGFQVAEYRKPEYELSAATDKPEYIQGEQIDVTVQANYFFGGPVKNGKVRWTLMSADAPFNYGGTATRASRTTTGTNRCAPARSAGRSARARGRPMPRAGSASACRPTSASSSAASASPSTSPWRMSTTRPSRPRPRRSCTRASSTSD